jgi:hypothetical protein
VNKSTWMLAAALLATGLFAGMQWRDLRDQRAQSAALAERVNALESELAAVKAAPAAPTPQIAAAEPAPMQPKPAAPQATPASVQPPALAQSGVRKASSLNDMLADPQMREMTNGMVRMMMPQMYPDVGKVLNLTDDEVQKLFDLLARQQIDIGMDSMDMIAGKASDPAAVQESQRKLTEKQQASEAELAELLGTRYPKWKEYESTRVARQQVQQFESTLGSSSRLSDAQRDELITALAAAEKATGEETRAAPPVSGRTQQEMMDNELKTLKEHNRRMVEAATAHLTPTQLDAFRRMMDQQTDSMNLMMRSLGQPE